ncbi:MAG: hypothetical protein HY579_13180 [Nitrospinae bacterium]|nr:hypothetical protein [Nitrospinota bacterium]
MDGFGGHGFPSRAFIKVPVATAFNLFHHVYIVNGFQKEYTGGDKEREIYFRADKALDYGFVVDVFAAIRNAGILNIGMVTDPAGRAG